MHAADPDAVPGTLLGSPYPPLEYTPEQHRQAITVTWALQRGLFLLLDLLLDCLR